MSKGDGAKVRASTRKDVIEHSEVRSSFCGTNSFRVNILEVTNSRTIRPYRTIHGDT